MVAAPFGQRRPSVWGVSGWPSMSMILSPLEYTSWMQPTAQYGHTPGCTFASLILSVVAAAATGRMSMVAVPTAAPAVAEPASLKKSRRDKPMVTPRCVRSTQSKRRRPRNGALGVEESELIEWRQTTVWLSSAVSCRILVTWSDHCQVFGAVTLLVPVDPIPRCRDRDAPGP